MTSSYCYAVCRVRRLGESRLGEPVWPESVGTRLEFQYRQARVAYAQTEIGKPCPGLPNDVPVVYKELVVRKSDSSTFGKEIVYVELSEGKAFPVGEVVEEPPPDEFKDAPVPFKRWWVRNSERAGDLFWSAFQAGRELGRSEEKEDFPCP